MRMDNILLSVLLFFFVLVTKLLIALAMAPFLPKIIDNYSYCDDVNLNVLCRIVGSCSVYQRCMN
jgi:hypothetical protein